MWLHCIEIWYCQQREAKFEVIKLWAVTADVAAHSEWKTLFLLWQRGSGAGDQAAASYPQQSPWQLYAWLKSDIASPRCDEQKESKEKGRRGGSWFHGLRGERASVTWEWIGVMTLFLSASWVHLYTYPHGGRANDLSKHPLMKHLDKGANGQTE